MTKLIGVALAAWLLGRAATEFASAETYHQEVVRANAQATATAKGAVPAARTLVLRTANR